MNELIMVWMSMQGRIFELSIYIGVVCWMGNPFFSP